VINLKNSSNTVLNTVNYTITVPGRHAVPLGFIVAPGTNYKLDLVGSTGSLKLYQNNSGALYAYSINNVMEITGNTANQLARYYYLYDWVITINSCESNVVPVSVIVGQSPNVNLGPDQVACDMAFVNAYVPGINNPNQYVWNTGYVGPLYKITTSGQYFVEVTSSNGCKKRDTINVTVMEGNLGWATDTSACLSLNLDAFLPNALSYLWSNNEVTPAITVTSSGTYWVQVTLSNGCIYRDTIQVTIDTQVHDIQIVLGDTVVQSQNVIVQADSINQWLWFRYFY